MFRRRRTREAPPHAGPAPPGFLPDPLARYADLVTVVVRHTPQQGERDPDYEVASLARFAAGGDVPAEDLREDTLRWLIGEGFAAHNEIAFERRYANVGASGAEVAIVLSLLGGAVSGLTQEAVRFIAGRLSDRTENLVPLAEHLDDLDQLRYAVSRAFEVRPSELRLVEQRGSHRHHAAVFEDRAGRFYGARVEASTVTIRRLQPGEW